jgi:hypothetical protein
MSIIDSEDRVDVKGKDATHAGPASFYLPFSSFSLSRWLLLVGSCTCLEDQRLTRKPNHFRVLCLLKTARSNSNRHTITFDSDDARYRDRTHVSLRCLQSLTRLSSPSRSCMETIHSRTKHRPYHYTLGLSRSLMLQQTCPNVLGSTSISISHLGYMYHS